MEQTQIKNKLDNDDKIHITEIFDEDIVPRLMRMDARRGNINCKFAGEQYENWVIEFKSTRSGFEIVNFEYDEDSRSFELARRPLTNQINDKNGKRWVSGCRLHNEDSIECSGKLTKYISKYGGQLLCCEKAFNEILGKCKDKRAKEEDEE